jgi:sulfide:quinone oxidoreductase
VIEDCNLDGGNAGYLPTDKATLKAKDLENVYVIGDNTDLPTSKAGSVAHFASEILCENLLREIEGLEPRAVFDGHSNCFIESGFEKGILIDFNYDVEPLPGRFPLPGVGPFALLQETRMNHWGKLMFKWIYWNILLKDEEMPLEPQMSMFGKWAD